MERLRVARAVWSALAALLALGLLLVPAPAPAAEPAPARTGRLLVDAAGWHGRAVRRPHDHTAVRASTAPPTSGWSAGTVALGTGLTRPDGSRRVREVQRRLRRLGYATGRVDGIYGPRTRAAVSWFQRKHGLPLSGSASLATVRHLRQRTGAGRRDRPADSARTQVTAAPAPAGATEARAPWATPRVVRRPDPGSDSVPWAIAAVLAGAGVALLAAGLAVRRRGRRQARHVRPGVVPGAHPVPVVAPSRSGRPRALGYVRLARGAPSASFHAQAAAIEAGCRSRGITLVSLVSDLEPDRGATDRPPALTFALDRLESGDADRLVVSRLDHLAPSSEEPTAVLGSPAARRAGLVVLDRDLDTAVSPDPAPDAVAALDAEPARPPHGGRWSPGGLQAAAVRRRTLHTAGKEHTDG